MSHTQCKDAEGLLAEEETERRQASGQVITFSRQSYLPRIKCVRMVFRIVTHLCVCVHSMVYKRHTAHTRTSFFVFFFLIYYFYFITDFFILFLWVYFIATRLSCPWVPLWYVLFLQIEVRWGELDRAECWFTGLLMEWETTGCDQTREIFSKMFHTDAFDTVACIIEDWFINETPTLIQGRWSSSHIFDARAHF